MKYLSSKVWIYRKNLESLHPPSTLLKPDFKERIAVTTSGFNWRGRARRACRATVVPRINSGENEALPAPGAYRCARAHLHACTPACYCCQHGYENPWKRQSCWRIGGSKPIMRFETLFPPSCVCFLCRPLVKNVSLDWDICARANCWMLSKLFFFFFLFFVCVCVFFLVGIHKRNVNAQVWDLLQRNLDCSCLCWRSYLGESRDFLFGFFFLCRGAQELHA